MTTMIVGTVDPPGLFPAAPDFLPVLPPRFPAATGRFPAAPARSDPDCFAISVPPDLPIA